MKIIVLGAGVVGISTAFYLARAGFKVSLLDAESHPASKTSFANGGQLSYSHVDPLASSTILPRLPKMILNQDSAFHLGLGNNKHFINWGLKFLANCNSKKEKQTINNLLSISSLTRKEIKTLNNEFHLDFDYKSTGKLHLYHSLKELNATEKKIAIKQTAGVIQQRLSKEQCVDILPTLKPYSDNFIGGTFSPGDEVGDAYKFSQELLTIAQEKYSLELKLNLQAKSFISTNGKISAIKTNQGLIEADRFVVCLGVHTPILLRSIGINIPIYPMKGYSISLQAKDAEPMVSVTDAKNKLVFSKLGNKLRVAGLAHFCGYDLNINQQYVQQLLKTAQTILPDSADYNDVIHKWVGLRPMMPNSTPIVGKTKYPNVWLNSGHGMLGWTLSLGSAVRLRDAMIKDLD